MLEEEIVLFMIAILLLEIGIKKSILYVINLKLYNI